MEIDLIFLPKNKQLSVEEIDKEFNNIIKSLFYNVGNNRLTVHLGENNANKNYIVDYYYNVLDDRILYLKLESMLSEMEAAKLLDFTVNKIIKGKHRGNYDIIISYNETSLVYCNKLMPMFGEFERRLRQILYTTLVKIFQIEWLNQSFEQTLINDLKSKRNVDKNKLIENALDELTYEQLKSFLFVPYTLVDIDQVINVQLSEDTLQKLSKEEIISIVNKCRKRNLWDKFFQKEDDLSSIPLEINYLQEYRNKVMHNKNITYEEFVEVRKRLKHNNKNLKKAILNLESSIYYSYDILDIAESLGNMVRKAIDNFAPALQLLAKAVSDAVENYNLHYKDTLKQLAETISKVVVFANNHNYYLPDRIPTEETNNDGSKE